MSGRLRLETFDGYADTAALAAAWDASDLSGCSLDGSVTYQSHQTLKFDPSTGGPAFLEHALLAGTTRTWARVIYKPSATSYTAASPSAGAGPVPVGSMMKTAAWDVIGGAFETTDGSHFRTMVKATGPETLTAHGSEALVAADLRALGFVTQDTLTESLFGGERFRVRVWRNAVLVADGYFSPAAPIDAWTAWRLTLDPAVANADSAVWIGEVQLWDADIHPDPFKHAFLFADGFGAVANLTEYGTLAQDESQTSLALRRTSSYGCYSSRRTVLLSPGTANKPYGRFLGKDTLDPEPELCVHFAMRAAKVNATVPICTFRSGVGVTNPGGTPADFQLDWRGNNAEQCGLYYRADGFLEFRAGGVVLGTTDVAIPQAAVDEPTLNEPLFNTVQAAMAQVVVQVHGGTGGADGRVAVWIEGVPALRLEGVDVTADGAVVTFHAVNLGVDFPLDPTTNKWNIDFADWLITRGIVYGYLLTAVDNTKPNANGADQDFTIGNDGFTPLANAFNLITPTIQSWNVLGYFIRVNPYFVSVPVGGAQIGKMESVKASALPDTSDCKGFVAAIVPTPTLNRLAGGDGGGANTTAGLYLRRGSNRYVQTQSGTRQGFPARGPFPPGQGVAFANLCWTLDPGTGDQWAATDLDGLEFGVSVLSNALKVFNYDLQVVRVRQPVATGVEPLMFPRKNLAWRPTNRVFVQKNLAMRQAIRGFQYRDLAWHSLVGVGGSVDDCAGHTVAINETFPTDDQINMRLWVPTRINGTIRLTGSRIEMRVQNFPAHSNQGGTASLFSNTLDLTGGHVDVNLPALVDDGELRVQALLLSNLLSRTGGNAHPAYPGMWYRKGNLELVTGDFGAATTLAAGVSGATIVHTTAMHPWWRLQHDAGTGLVSWWVSDDGVAWGMVSFAGVPFDARFTQLAFLVVNVERSGLPQGDASIPGAFDNIRTSGLVTL